MLENRDCSFPIQLLVEDRLGQAMEGRLAILHPARPNFLDDGTEHRITLPQMIDRLSHDLLVYHKIALWGE
jgi:hypothetical protein